MATYTVTAVRRADAADRSHRHIEGVCTANGDHYALQEVVDSIHGGEDWAATADGLTAELVTSPFCPAPGCLLAPYLRTEPDFFDDLDALPDC